MLQERLKAAGIPTAIYYPKTLHFQTAFQYLGYGQGDFLISEDFPRRIFSLPMHPYLSSADQERIAAVLNGG
jgi:dTDP-4-amino-4,6-dideoxygalactose transaminase